MPVHVCVCAFAQCSYFQFSQSLHHCLRSLCCSFHFSFPFRFYNSIVGSNKSSSWQWQSARNTVSLQLKMPSIVFFLFFFSPSLYLSYSFSMRFFRLNCLLCSWFLCHREFHRVDIFHLFSTSVNSFSFLLPYLFFSFFLFIVCIGHQCQPHSSKINMSKRI